MAYKASAGGGVEVEFGHFYGKLYAGGGNISLYTCNVDVFELDGGIGTCFQFEKVGLEQPFGIDGASGTDTDLAQWLVVQVDIHGHIFIDTGLHSDGEVLAALFYEYVFGEGITDVNFGLGGLSFNKGDVDATAYTQVLEEGQGP